MVGFTANQWAILFLVLVLGWLLGLMSRSGGAKWRRAAADERVGRERAEAQLATANARIAELERNRPVVATVDTPVSKPADPPVDPHAERAIVDGEDDIP